MIMDDLTELQKELNAELLFELKIKTINNGYSFSYRNNAICYFQNTKNGYVFLIPANKKDFADDLTGYEELKIGFRKPLFNVFDFKDVILTICNRLDESFEAPLIFGCCHLYEDCSDEKKCVQPDKIFARGCQYKKSLEKGLIFYGKNRNV